MIKKFYLPILILAAFITSCDFRSAYDTEIYAGNGVHWQCKPTNLTKIKTPHFECQGVLKVCDYGSVSPLYDVLFTQHISQMLVAECNDGTTYWNVTDLELKSKQRVK